MSKQYGTYARVHRWTPSHTCGRNGHSQSPYPYGMCGMSDKLSGVLPAPLDEVGIGAVLYSEQCWPWGQGYALPLPLPLQAALQANCSRSRRIPPQGALLGGAWEQRTSGLQVGSETAPFVRQSLIRRSSAPETMSGRVGWKLAQFTPRSWPSRTYLTTASPLPKRSEFMELCTTGRPQKCGLHVVPQQWQSNPLPSTCVPTRCHTHWHMHKAC